MQKLKQLGIAGKLGRWLCSFLTRRTQSVVVNGIQSEPTDVLSRVPQGSVLGLLLFLILIGDIDKSVISSFLSSFADGMQIGKGIASKEDAIELQRDFSAVYQWAIYNNMQFNFGKFECVLYGRDK